jgi:hypothetical protein
MPRAQPFPVLPRGYPGVSEVAIPTRAGTEKASTVRSLPQPSQRRGAVRSAMLRIA